MISKFGHKELFAFMISMIILTDLTILSNIPFLRQFMGFIFLTFLPGLLILQTIKLNKTGLTENFVLSMGLSVSFVMLFGLLLNNSLLTISHETPLATIPLLIAFNIAFIMLAIIGYKINRHPTFAIPNLELNTYEKAFLIVPILFLPLSIFGTHIMNTAGSNTILVFLLFLIPSYVVFVCFFNQKFPKRLYPVVIFLIGVSLLLMLALRSNHIIGIDTHKEYYFFQTTLNNLHWSVFGHSTLDACLSISLLPTIYQSLLNISPEILFRILYSLLYSISPLVIYVLSKKYLEDLYAFLVSCFFMFQLNFLFTEYNARTNIAILFFALSMMVLFSDKINLLEKKILLIIFIVSCIISHYSTTYIFFFIMAGTFVGIEILSKRYALNRVVSSTIVLLFFSLIFFWYSQVTEVTFISGMKFIANTITNLSEFFVEESRGISAQTLLGKEIMQKSNPYKIEFLLTWVMFAVIGIGIITSIRRYKEMVFIDLNLTRMYFLKEKFDVVYFIIALICSGLLVVMIAFPYMSKGYNLDRLYAVAIVTLGTFFVIGGATLSKFLKFRTYAIILFVMIPYFFCISGVMYTMFGVPHTVILDSQGGQHDTLYVYDQESYSAKWWGEYKTEYQKIHSDFHGRNRLISQGNIKPALISCYWLSNHNENNRDIKGYFYLRCQNIANGELTSSRNEMYNMTDYQNVFTKKSAIYDAGCSKILR